MNISEWPLLQSVEFIRNSAQAGGTIFVEARPADFSVTLRGSFVDSLPPAALLFGGRTEWVDKQNSDMQILHQQHVK